MKNKMAIEHCYIKIDNLKEGVNSRQCASRGIVILQASITRMGWVDTADIIVTVHPDCELQFKDCLQHFHIMTAMKLTGKEVWEGYDAAKAAWIVEACLFLIVDGHHRVMGLNACWEAKLPGLPRRVR
jgi:hypothetical protein